MAEAERERIKKLQKSSDVSLHLLLSPVLIGDATHRRFLFGSKYGRSPMRSLLPSHRREKGRARERSLPPLLPSPRRPESSALRDSQGPAIFLSPSLP
jgi:hypothetical protein